MTRVAVPFVPQVRSGNPAEEAAKQLTDAIAKWAADGWAYVRLESITTIINNGCISAILGNAVSTTTFQVAVLERKE